MFLRWGKIFLFLFLFLEITKLHARNPIVNVKQVAIAEKNLPYQKKTQEKVKTILDLSSWYYQHYNDSKVDARKSLSYAYEAFHLSNEIKYREGTAESSLKLAVILQQAQEYYKAKSFALQAIKNYQNLNLQNELGESWVMYWSASFLTGTGYKDRIPLLRNASIAFHKAGNKEREADCYKEIGDIYQLLGNGSEAIRYLKKSLSLYNKSNFHRLYGVYDLLGNVYHTMGDHKIAIFYGLKAARLAEKVHDNPEYLCTVYNRIGVSYFDFQDYQNAQKYFLQSLNIAMKTNNIPAMRLLTYNYGNVLIRENKVPAALKFINKMKERHPQIFEEDAILLNCQYVQIYMLLKQNSKAQNYLKPIKKELTDSTIYHNKMVAYATIIKLSLNQKKYAEANIYLSAYDSMANKIKTNMYYSNSSLYKYIIDSAQGNCSSAMKNYRDYVKYSKNLYDENKTRQINQMTILYESEKKNRNIVQLKNKAIIQENKLHQASILNNLMLISTISLLIIATLLYRVYRLKQRTNKILNEQQNEIHQKNQTLQNLVTEKEWLLREIHHRVKNNLHMVVGLLASQAEFLKNDEAIKAINESQNRIQSMSLIHQKLYQSENLSMLNMPSYIFELTEYLKDSFDKGKSIRFILDIDNFDLPLSHSIPIGLIFNEAITNSIKYAFPNAEKKEIKISLKNESPEKIILTIHDNGIGLPAEFDPFNNPSLGIKLMYGLSEDIKGRFTIENDMGTKIVLVFSIDENNND